MPPPPPVKPAEAVPAVRPPRARAKNDPKLVAAARELRDRWLERVNAGALAAPAGKYDVGRMIAGADAVVGTDAVAGRDAVVVEVVGRSARRLPAPGRPAPVAA